MHTNFWSEDLKKRDELEDVGVPGRIILEWILKRQIGDAENVLGNYLCSSRPTYLLFVHLSFSQLHFGHSFGTLYRPSSDTGHSPTV